MPAKTTAGPSPTVSELEHKVAELSDRLRAQREEYNEALQREAALAEILRVINEPGTDLARVFSVMIEKATKLCSASYGYVWRYDGKHVRAVAASAQQTFGDWLRDSEPRVPAEQSPLGKALLSHRLVHVIDAKEDEAYKTQLPFRELVDRGGVRTLLHVPLLKGHELLGVITVYRQEPRAFSERQIALIESFAAQAVVALENARLLTEQREALERQTATAEVLQVINSSPGDLTPVFETILARAHALCGVVRGSLLLYDGERFRAVAVHNLPETLATRLREGYEPGPNHPSQRLLAGEDYAQVRDMAEIDDPIARATVELGQIRTLLYVALRKDGKLLGQIVANRTEVRPFTDKQISLLQSFAAQAVIAMENARLLGELRQRTYDLQRSLEYQTATSQVLEVISRSAADVQPVLDSMVAAATRLCNAHAGTIAVRQGEVFRHVATVGVGPVFDKALRERPLVPGRGTITERVLLEKQIVHVADLETEPGYELRAAARSDNLGTTLGVPLLREGEPIGVFTLSRDRVELFSERQIALVRTFADQAVIAMENARLLGELRESLDQQTATAEVLQVINSSPDNLAPVFDAILEKAHALCQVEYGSLQLYDGTKFHAVAVHGLPEPLAARLRQGYVPGPTLRQLIDGAGVVHIPDMAVIDDPMARVVTVEGGIRTLLRVALRKDRKLLGQIVSARKEVRPFADKEIALLQSFAAQAVIAIENARLINETREALEQQTATAEILRVISQSPTDVQPVFDAIVESAVRLSDSLHCTLYSFDGAIMHLDAHYQVGPETLALLKERFPGPPDRDTVGGR